VRPRVVNAILPCVRAAALAVAVLAGVLALGGCGSVGYVDEGDRQAGKQLFATQCGQCHTLADAGTKGQVGPNLDDGFRQARKDGMTEETVVQVVRGQIQYPIENPVTGVPGMPGIDQTLPKCEGDRTQGCVEDQDEAANSIAVYVADVAGLEQPAGGSPAPPAPPPPSGGTTEPGDGGGAADGKQVFARAGCGSCHTLADAGTTGTVGPNLDEAKPTKELAVDRVTNGQGAMPPFKGQLSDDEIDAVATYVSGAAGK
jgi:mono/diheme cytochrome c family protein